MKATEPSRTPPPQSPRHPPASPRNAKKKETSFAGLLGARHTRSAAVPVGDAPHRGSPEGTRRAEPADPLPRRPVPEPRGSEESNAEPPRLDPVDPWARALAHPVLGASPVRPPPPPPAQSLGAEVVLEQLVRRLSWGGNGRRGSARVVVGAGALAGATIVVHVDGSEVSLELETPNGIDDDEWRSRLVSRLERRGLVVIP